MMHARTLTEFDDRKNAQSDCEFYIVYIILNK